jgi:tRNA (guanine37-N1)-methyltransferase
MRVAIITLFPEMFNGPFSSSILKIAQEKGLIEISYISLRDFGLGKRKQVDDTPYGGGPGMVLRVDVMAEAINFAKNKLVGAKTILLTPQGQTFNQEKARALSASDLILISGHYEGYDERIRGLVDEEISIGDYVLTGGEIPAMVLVDSVARLIPGVLGKEESYLFESYSDSHLLEHPQYTRPEEWQGQKVPDILLSGNHQEIKKWRDEKSRDKTKKRFQK